MRSFCYNKVYAYSLTNSRTVLTECFFFLLSRSQYQQQHGTTTRESYLHEGNWQFAGPLEDQRWAQEAMAKFQSKQEQWQHRKCTICNEQWPVRSRLNLQPYCCLRCQRDKNTPKVLSKENDMDPREVPSCLEGMTQVEEMLIARACPIMTVYRKHGGQRGYSGHVLNLPQNIQHFLNKLPPRINELPILQIKRTGANNTEAHFRVRREKVLQALLWLKRNNKFYHNIEIDMDLISCLPLDGIPGDIHTVTVDDNDTSETQEPTTPDDDNEVLNEEGSNEGISSTSFMPQPQNVQREEDAIRSSIDGQNWPPLGKCTYYRPLLYCILCIRTMLHQHAILLANNNNIIISYLH